MKGDEKIIKMINQKLREIRCRKYNRLLMKGDVLQIEIKCPKCGYMQKLRADRVLGGKIRELREGKYLVLPVSDG